MTNHVLDASHDAGIQLAHMMERAHVSGVREVGIVVTADVRCDRALVDMMEHLVRAAPKLERVTLFSRSASVRFLASTLSLRIPTVRVVVEEGDREASRPPTIPRSLPSRAADRPPPVRRFDIDPHRGLRAEFDRIFARIEARAVRAVALCFPEDKALPRGLSRQLEPWLQRTQLVELTLVHPSGVTGFAASTLGLRFPRMRIRASGRAPI